MSKDLGFACHVSQLRDFSWYLSQGKTAAEFRKYNPCEYGLFRSTVGEDVQKDDFFENVLSYGEEALKQAEEEAARLEQQRLAEEQARKQAEEEQLRQQEESRKKEQELQQAAEAAAQEKSQRGRMVILIGCGIAAALAVLVIVMICILAKQRRNCKY